MTELTELEILKWSFGIMASALTGGLAVAVWIIWRLQQIPRFGKRLDDHSGKIDDMSTIVFRLQAQMEMLLEELRNDRRARQSTRGPGDGTG